ncbi:hypothetical protein NliqN6_2884 [Naganishia liquefaciens]|uniref:Uncharacterized protein n=1 Tax=Naganishia liquefaciens TaxID=104408 RepID=A0A8H3TSR2_9TREE|nr:hypothetical protein NliqN6_2884 [Naganishia liquefaciens]
MRPPRDLEDENAQYAEVVGRAGDTFDTDSPLTPLPDSPLPTLDDDHVPIVKTLTSLPIIQETNADVTPPEVSKLALGTLENRSKRTSREMETYSDSETGAEVDMVASVETDTDSWDAILPLPTWRAAKTRSWADLQQDVRRRRPREVFGSGGD